MKAIYDLPAPAKLNLFLHITGRREDGYHLLQSVFMLIDWCDTLHVELRSDGQLSREDLTTELPPDDLVLRAARALQAHAAPGQGAHIGIAKQVPAQAGMGGGSSDAATCLLALNRLWGWTCRSRAWPRSACNSAPTCRSSWAGAMPGSRESARKSGPWTSLPHGSWWPSHPRDSTPS